MFTARRLISEGQRDASQDANGVTADTPPRERGVPFEVIGVRGTCPVQAFDRVWRCSYRHCYRPGSCGSQSGESLSSTLFTDQIAGQPQRIRCSGLSVTQEYPGGEVLGQLKTQRVRVDLKFP